MERLRGETTFLISSHVLAEVEASCDRMLILNRGRIVAEGTLPKLQAEYIDKTVLEIVAGGERKIIERAVRKVDPGSELTEESPADATGRRRFSFTTSRDKAGAEEVLRVLVADDALQMYEFVLARPDLETIFLKATKRSWEETGSPKQTFREVSVTPQPEEGESTE